MYTQRMNRSPTWRWDWPATGLLLLLIQSSAARLVSTDWTPFLYFTETLAALGTILGSLLGYSGFRRRAVLWLGAGYTLTLIPWQLTGAVDLDLPLRERLAEVGTRLLVSMGQFLQRQPVDDPLFFVAFVSLLFWIIAVVAGYWLVRHNSFLPAVLPAGVGLLIVQAYDHFEPRRMWWLATYLIFALLLLGRLYYLESRAGWKKRRVFTTSDTELDVNNGLLATAILVVVVAWLLPISIANVETAAQTWERVTRPFRERFSNAVSALESPYGGGGKGDFYGQELALGRSGALGDATVFTVRVISGAVPIPRFYWRGRVYDFYSNGQWTLTEKATQDFLPGKPALEIPDRENRTEVRLTFITQFAYEKLLYTPSQPIWVDRPGTLRVTRLPGTALDPLAWETARPLSSGDDYQVRAALANPSIEELRAAGSAYPQWVLDRYLQIPGEIAPRIREQAASLTLGVESPYDKAAVITNYLRQDIQYQDVLDPAPKGIDPILWVMFDYKKGFCNYYATAEVLMLRSIGIPARMAVGFAQGEYDQESKSYTVRKKEAHAWPEVYFPGIGWVEFEPTGNQDPLVRREASSQGPAGSGLPGLSPTPSEAPRDQTNRADELLAGEDVAPTPFNRTPLGRGLIIGIPLAAAVLFVLANRRYGLIGRLPVYLKTNYERQGMSAPQWLDRWARWMGLTPIERSFEVVNLSLYWLRVPQPVHATAAERARELERALPSAAEAIEALASEHQTALFTPRPADASRARRAGWTILLHAMRARLKSAWSRLIDQIGL
jgi:transglutaminase-like putative cysteine protease